MPGSIVDALLRNDPEVFRKAAIVIIKICQRILEDPSNMTLRSLSVGSTTFIEKLLPAEGALNCLFFIGFEEGTGSLNLPLSTPLDNLLKLHDALLSRCSDFIEKTRVANTGTLDCAKAVTPLMPANINTQCNTTPSTSAKTNLSAPRQPSKLPLFQRSRLDNVKIPNHNSFCQKVIYYSDFVLKYENIGLKLKALQCIPVLELTTNVENAIRGIQAAYKKKEVRTEHSDYQELLLLALLQWFKKDFFSWVDKPPCSSCSSDKTLARGTRPSSDNSVDRYEVYGCENCGAEVLFPRYNDPEVLLQERRGRCGEWANCFTLLCRALGWDARLVVDETDHVWTEVYLLVTKRWVHCDPCEGVLDAPLMYESGWGKKLSYILAYSHEEAQDVTWRYSSHHKEVLLRRRLTGESELLSVIMQIRSIRMEGLTNARSKFIIKRTVQELADMLMERTASANELQGRSSGSLAWRLARWETGVSAGNVWKIGRMDVKSGNVVIGYSAAANCYIMGESKKENWENGVFLAHGIQLKVEKDWKMTYLARSEGCEKSKIVWKFELIDGLSMGKIMIVFQTAIYQSGKISVFVCSGDVCIPFPKDSDKIETDAFSGQCQLEVVAELSGGDGNCAWQHTQLFRQSILDKSILLPFLVKIHVI